MPIFEYKCNECGSVIEKLFLLDTTDAVYCDCGEQMERVLSRPNFNLAYPSQSGGVHSMAGGGKRARFRQGD